jgi:hypothetical protein
VHFPREPKSFPHSHAPAFVASHDAPLIGERAGTRGRIAMEGGDEHAGEIELPVSGFRLAHRIEPRPRLQPRGPHRAAETAIQQPFRRSRIMGKRLSAIYADTSARLDRSGNFDQVSICRSDFSDAQQRGYLRNG